MEKLEVNVVPATQFGRKIYVGAMSADDIVALFNLGVLGVDEFKPGVNEEGYQRASSSTRAKRFAKFIGQERISPPALTLYVREHDNGVEVKQGKLHVPKGNTDKPLLYITDGQHRVRGLDYALRNQMIDGTAYNVPFTVTFAKEDERDPRYEEAGLFFYINTTAKRVRTDLAYDYLMREEEKESGAIREDTMIPVSPEQRAAKAFASRIVNDICKNRGVWKGRIKLSNEDSEPNKLKPSKSEFARSLLVNYMGSGSVLSWAANRGLDLKEFKEALNNYWDAVFELCPNASDPAEAKRYHLLKTTGIHAFNGLLPSLTSVSQNLPKVPSKNDFKKVLERMGDYVSDGFWESSPRSGREDTAASYGTSGKSFKLVIRDMFEALREA